MTTTMSKRAATLLTLVDSTWRTTSNLDTLLYVNGFTWGAATTRSLLQALHETGAVERRRVGAGYRWRKPAEVANPHPATVDDLGVIVDKIAAIAREVADMTVVAPPPAKVITIGDDVDLVDLTAAQGHLAQRIVKRAAYETGKAMLTVLAGWVEGARGDHESSEHREDDCCSTFTADDVARMVNDAMRVMGAPEVHHS
jgi:hypothetical protein